MKKVLFFIIAMVCAALNVQASISVWPTKTNGVDGYGIYNWDNPGDVAAFLDGSYQGTVYNGNDPDDNWVTTLLPLVKAAETVKFGGSADSPKEPIGTTDLQALELLTGVKYLRLDNCFPAEGTDFSKIKIGSSALLDATMPVGLTKDQIKQANDALKDKASGLKTTSGITGTATPRVITHYYYTFPWDTETQIELENATEGQTTVTFNNYPVEVDLKLETGYPMFSYQNNKTSESRRTVTISAEEYNAHHTQDYVNNVLTDLYTPTKLEVELTYEGEVTTSYCVVNGVQYEQPVDPSQYEEINGKYYLKQYVSIYNGAYGGNFTQGTEVVFVTAPRYTYTFLNNYSETTKVYNGTPTIIDGHYYGEVPNSYPGNGYRFPVSSSYKYTYTDIDGSSKPYPSEGSLSTPDEDMKYTVYYSGTRDLTTTQETVMELTVDGSTIYVNEAGTLSDADYMFTNAQNTNFKSSKNITVMGNVNNTDLDYLKADNFASAKLIDVSETTKASGATYGTLTSAATDAALFLPKAVTKAELITLEAPNNNSRTCAYVEKEDEDGNRVMHVYANSGSVANLAPVVDNKTAIYFLKYYGENGDTWAGAPYSGGNEAFRLGLGALHAISMDFTNYQAYLMPDFRHLTSDTHFLTVGQNTNQTVTTYDFTADVAASNYKYGSNVWVVSTYKSGDNVSKAYQGKSLEAIGETALITYIREAGKMEQAAPFLSEEQQNASRVIFVTKDGVSMTESDIECISYMNCNKLDFLDATVSDANLLALDNDKVKYIALPDNSAAITATSPDKFSFSKCASLLSVASYNTTTDTYRVHSTKNLDSNGKQIESVYVLTQIIRPKPSKRSSENEAAGLTKVDFSGYFNFADIATDNTTNHGLFSAVVKTAELTNAVFPDNQDMNFSAAGWENLTSINLPTSATMTTLSASCFENMQKLESLCIPINYQYIKENVFHNCVTLKHVYTTPFEGLEENQNDHGDGTITLPPGLKEIKSGAFSFVDAYNPGITDVYVLSKDAPKCAPHAFSPMMTYGNNTYALSHPYSRDMYKANDHIMTVLHFPNELTEAQKKKYTDITRKYSLMDETGDSDADGNPMVWPTQAEFNRAMMQGNLGYLWDEWPARDANGNLDNSGCSQAKNGSFGGFWFTYDNRVSADAINDNKNEIGDYLGWHEFALCGSGYFYDVVTQDETEYYELDWYTLCIPYDLTPEMVAKAAGVQKVDGLTKTLHRKDGTVEITNDFYPELRTFTAIQHDLTNGNITLTISTNLSKFGELKAFSVEENKGKTSELGSGAPLIKGGYPYIIRPVVPKSVYDELAGKFEGAGKYIMSKLVDKDDLKGNTEKFDLGGENPIDVFVPCEKHQIIAVGGGENLTEKVGDVEKPYLYNFMGTYKDRTMPKYSYYIGKDKSSGAHKFFRSTSAKKKWNAYSAIIAPLGEAKYEVKTVDKSQTVVMVYSEEAHDDTRIINAPSRYQFVFADGGVEDLTGVEDEATSIETLDGELVSVPAGKIYNLGGQYVGSSLEGLSKGLYIVNGKKFVVK